MVCRCITQPKSDRNEIDAAIHDGLSKGFLSRIVQRVDPRWMMPRVRIVR